MGWSSLIFLQRHARPPLALGVLVIAVCVAGETALATALSKVTPVQSLDVVYLIGVLLVSSLWGLGLGLATAVASTVAFDLFLTAPAWSLRPTTSEFLAILLIFAAIACLAFFVSALRRMLALETQARRDSDLTAYLARRLLDAPDLTTAMRAIGQGLTDALNVSSALIEPGDVPAGTGRRTFPLRGADMRATLSVPTDLPKPTFERLRDRVVPSLEVLLRAAGEREKAADALRAGRDELQKTVEEQAALRRLATLVARNAPPAQAFDAVAREMAQVLGVRHTVIARYEPDGTSIVMAGRGRYARFAELGSRWPLEEGTVPYVVWHRKAPERIGAFDATGPVATRLRESGLVSAVGCPIMVGPHMWGVAIVASSTPEPFPPGTERRMLNFTEIAAAAIVNAQNHADLLASRARVVAASDEARRRIERDLHDGTQQNLVSIGLELRAIEASVPPGLQELRERLAESTRAVEIALAEVQEISRGLHPALLAKGGLRTALAALARRSVVPADITVSAEHRLPDPVQVTLYYIVSESLTNAAKHAGATSVRVDLTTSGTLVRLSIHDNGIGGADPASGSGLAGLIDRVEALGGTIRLDSPAGGGTTLLAEIPHENVH